MKREGRIFLSILESGSAGTSLTHLEHRLEIAEKSLPGCLKKLIQKKLVRRGKGGHGRFFATKQGLEILPRVRLFSANCSPGDFFKIEPS